MAELRAWDSGQHIALQDATNANRCRGWKLFSIPTTPRMPKVRTQTTSTLSDTAIRRPSNISQYAYCGLENARTWLLAVVGFTRALSRHPRKPSVNEPCKQSKYKQRERKTVRGYFKLAEQIDSSTAGEFTKSRPGAHLASNLRPAAKPLRDPGSQRVPNGFPTGSQRVPDRTTSVVFEKTSTNTYDMKHKVRPPSLQARA